MVKYFSNCYHALKVGFANEMGTMCKHLGVDAHAVTKIFTSDTKLNISPAYLSPGFASAVPASRRSASHHLQSQRARSQTPLLESLIAEQCRARRSRRRYGDEYGQKENCAARTELQSRHRRSAREPAGAANQAPHGRGPRSQVWDEDVSLGRLAGSNRQYIEEVIPHIGSVLSADLEGRNAIRRSRVILRHKSASKEQLAKYLRPNTS